MSRATEVLNDLELAAKKLGMSIEEAVSILLGKHPTHVVVQAHKAAEETPAAASDAAEGQAANPNAPQAIPTGQAQTTAGTSAENDTPGAAA